jgi:hypothetical protein
MTDAAASEAARQLVARRWQGQRPTRLARELARRAAELPENERAELLAALERKHTDHTEQETA